jgi:DNA-binding transcriptional MerR regulator
VSEAGETASGRRANKRAAVFRTIGEVAEDLDLPAHVLRFWESKFPQLKPLKRGGGRRYYRPEDIALLSRIRQCLYQEGYTIRGVQKLLVEGTLGVSTGAPEVAPSLFPLDPLPALDPAPAPRPARTARRPSMQPAVAEAPAATVSLSDTGRAKLDAAVKDLLAAREMLETLLQDRRKT